MNEPKKTTEPEPKPPEDNAGLGTGESLPETVPPTDAGEESPK